MPAICFCDLLKNLSMLFGDKKGHLRLLAGAHPMHLKNIFDAVYA
jgi:hypothetical protein